MISSLRKKLFLLKRSEERRVGKECRSGWSWDQAEDGIRDGHVTGVQTCALPISIEKGAAVLITGGFDTTDEIKLLANEKKLPIISTSYDTFTVAAMINRAIYDQLIKKEIIFVEDILTPFDQLYYLKTNEKVKRWYELNKKTTHTRFPVVDEDNVVSGMVTAKDIIGKDKNLFIEKIMTRSPLVVKAKTSLAYVAHMMVWEGIEVVPIVDENSILLGLVSRQDVLKALQQV